MRLSLIISVTLLFGSALAIPAPMEGESPSPPPGGGSGKGKERAKSTTPPEQGGSQGSDPSSESTDAGLGFTGGPNKGFGSVATKYFVSVFFLAYTSYSERNVDSTLTTLMVTSVASQGNKERHRIWTTHIRLGFWEKITKIPQRCSSRPCPTTLRTTRVSTTPYQPRIMVSDKDRIWETR